MTIDKALNVNLNLAHKLIAQQFPEYKHLPIISVKKQGHDNRTFRLGKDKLIRIPTAAEYALKVPIEQELLPKLKPYLTVAIPEPIKMGVPSCDYPFHFSIYKWLDGESANNLEIDSKHLEPIAKQLVEFLKELHSITDIAGPTPGQHNWWRGSHINVYEEDVRQQIYQLKDLIDRDKAIQLWEKACKTKWNKSPVWIHGDFSSGNIIIKGASLIGAIDFGGMGVGDPACDLVIAWTFLNGKSRQIFLESLGIDDDTWLRSKAWCLWKATFELCQIQDKNSQAAAIQKKIIDEVLE